MEKDPKVETGGEEEVEGKSLKKFFFNYKKLLLTNLLI